MRVAASLGPAASGVRRAIYRRHALARALTAAADNARSTAVAPAPSAQSQGAGAIQRAPSDRQVSVIDRLRHFLRRLADPATPRSAGAVQALADLRVAVPLLRLHETCSAAQVAGLKPTPDEIQVLHARFAEEAAQAGLSTLFQTANDAMTVQLVSLFQACADIDAGDSAAAGAAVSSLSSTHTDVLRTALPGAAQAKTGEKDASAADFIGPSTHTNPRPTLRKVLSVVAERQASSASASIASELVSRQGFVLRVGPSQSRVPGRTAGVYVQGAALPGQVLGLYAGAVYAAEMLVKPEDAGHLANPSVPRTFVPRFDECVLDVDAPVSHKANPYAVAQHVTHPPKGIMPNAMRLQIDFMARTDAATGILAFPEHLRPYIPNVWGSDVTLGQELFGMLEQNIWVKGMALIALRPLYQEEIFVDHSLNPYCSKLPDWYTPLDEDAAKRMWARLGQ